MALVFDVISCSILSGLILIFSKLFISQNTGTAFTYLIAFTVAAKVREGQITSSPSETFNILNAKCSESVQFERETACFTFSILANCSSSSSHLGPVEIHFERIVSITANSSDSSKFNLKRGILYSIIRRYKYSIYSLQDFFHLK